MSYFASAEDLTAELTAALESFLDSDRGRNAARAAAAGFDLGDGLPEEPALVLITRNPDAAVTLILGDNAHVRRGGQDIPAQAQLRADADALHDTLAENYDAGQIARAVEEGRLNVSGPPWCLDALIVLAGAFAGFYRESLQRRDRQDLLSTSSPAPAGVWDVAVPRPEDFMGAVVPARREFNQRYSR
jgi:hypothetical protein